MFFKKEPKGQPLPQQDTEKCLDDVSENSVDTRKPASKLIIATILCSVVAVVVIIVLLVICGVVLSEMKSRQDSSMRVISVPVVEEPHNELTVADDLEDEREDVETETKPRTLAENCKVVTEPMSQAVVMGKDVTLNCKFDQVVDCRWMRNDSPVEINRRYRFLNTKDLSETTTDCSLNINKIRPIDIGNWVCMGLFSDQSLVTSRSATITTQQADNNALQIVRNPESTQVKQGESVTLSCEFNKEVECAWLRRGEQIDISGRYKFVEHSSSPERKDCSLEITRVGTIDDGEWQCSSMANSESNSLSAVSITLTVI